MTYQFPPPELLENNSGEIIAHRYEISDTLAQEMSGNWQRELSGFILQNLTPVIRDTSHERTIDDDPEALYGLWTTGGDLILGDIRFQALERLYMGPFRVLMQNAMSMLQPDTEIDVLDEPDLMMEAYTQTTDEIGDEDSRKQMDPHLDGRWTAILVVAVPEDEGGKLVVASNPEAVGRQGISRDATYISHRVGTLVCFPLGRKLPHYTEELLPDSEPRIIISLNYVSDDVSEADRGYRLDAASSVVNLS